MDENSSKEIRGNVTITGRTSSCPCEEEILQMLPGLLHGKLGVAPSVPEQVGAYTRSYFVGGCELSPHANGRIVSWFAVPTNEEKNTQLLSLSVR